MDTREAKLPQWAQNSLRVLRGINEGLASELAIANARAPATGATGKIMADCLGRDGFPLHDRCLIEFHLPHGKVSVMLRDNGARLDLNASIGTLCIHPQAANCAYVTVERG